MLSLILNEMIEDLKSIQTLTERFEGGSFSRGQEIRKPIRRTLKSCKEFIDMSLATQKYLKDEHKKSREGKIDGRSNNKGNLGLTRRKDG